MPTKPLPRTPDEVRAEREQQLKEFTEAALAGFDRDPTDSLLVIARSPSSAVLRVVFGLSGVLDAHRISARMVLMPGSEGERWAFDFSPGFAHEARIASDLRLLDAHEQLVIGDCATWFGDSMRREPERRDAYMQFAASDRETARRARATFDRIWAACRPLYRNEASPVIGPGTMPDGAGEAAMAQDALAVLGAWRPSSRH